MTQFQKDIMRYLTIITLIALGVSGCNQPGTGSSDSDPDNTGVNERDRDADTKTPIDQNENQTDIDLTAKIRSQVVDTKDMSVNAQNVKIITQDGTVTLRGPVKSAEEKKKIEDIARAVAGEDKVVSQLEVE
jgi:osmotically-inducible protein OsmY